MQSDAAATPQARRRARTEARLRQALARLLRDNSCRPTVAALAREAGVGRNAIYSNHSVVLAELREAAAVRAPASEEASASDRTRRQRSVIADLKHQLRQLATQNAVLLKRALDADAKAAQLDHRAAKLMKELDEIRRPLPLRFRVET